MPTIEISEYYMDFVNAIVDLQNMLADGLDEPVALADAHCFVGYLIKKEMDLVGGADAINFMRAALLDPGTSKFVKKKLGEFLESLNRGAGAQEPSK